MLWSLAPQDASLLKLHSCLPRELCWLGQDITFTSLSAKAHFTPSLLPKSQSMAPETLGIIPLFTYLVQELLSAIMTLSSALPAHDNPKQKLLLEQVCHKFNIIIRTSFF